MKKACRLGRQILNLYLFATITAVMLMSAKWPAKAERLADFVFNSSGLKADMSYSQYRALYQQAAEPTNEILAFEDLQGVDIAGEVGGQFAFHVSTSGLYCIYLEYMPLEGSGMSIEYALYLDGVLPFNEAEYLMLMRTYTNEKVDVSAAEGLLTADMARPKQQEVFRRTGVYLTDPTGMNKEPYHFYFEEGTHTLLLQTRMDSFKLYALTLRPYIQPKVYAQVYESYKDVAEARDVMIQIEGEDALYKSDFTLAPISDTSSSSTNPHDPKYRLYNAIGGTQYASVGQWLEWEFEIESEGLYCIAIKARQNVNSGLASGRKLLLDGKIPFAEAGKLSFTYSTDWKMTSLNSADEAYRFYFTPGKHTLKLEVCIGEGLNEILSQTALIMNDLSDIYRRVMVITGANPDTNRDYDFDRIIPDVIKEIGIQRDKLEKLYQTVRQNAGQNGENAQIFNRLYEQLRLMSEDNRRIASLLGAFRDNISSLGAWYTNALKQPLEIDYLLIFSPEKALPKANAGFLSEVGYGFEQFISTFGEETAPTVSGGGKTVKVWIGNNQSGGRDQAQVLRELISNGFEKESGIKVELELVSVGSLLPAVMAGSGPDIALTLSSAEPVNYAVRHAAMDLSGFPGFQEVAGRFHPSALTSLSFGGGVFGLPETESWYMMFYRSDILEQLGLELPETWEDVYNMLPVLQKNHMNFAMPAPLSDNAIGTGYYPFLMLLYQNGITIYNADGSSALLMEDAAVETFISWSKLYTEYELPINYDFPNRFRTGEFPIGIADYSMYNWINVFAPDLKGKWGIMLVPGTRQPDGSINRAVPALINSCMMLKNTKVPMEAWRFLEWWTRADTQTAYSRELESILGTAGRQPVANLQAMEKIAWYENDLMKLKAQLQFVFGVPEVPGSYFTSRHIDFAIKKVINQKKDPFDVLVDANEAINNELRSRRREFGLE